ncbi:MAG TPA: STAS domain-containing protein [Solirubrobacteraceae bacterium]|nr:STAS domain-containing protein [Solirubrobacteraceae bacterium]
MTGPGTFQIQESSSGQWLRLTLTGELDRFSTPILEDRLAPLRVARSPVRLNLSNLGFIDSTGIHLLIQTIGDARMKGWDFALDQDISTPVLRLLKLVHLDHFALSSEAVAKSGASRRLRRHAEPADQA